MGKSDFSDVELEDSNEIWRVEEYLFLTGFSPCWVSVAQEENNFFTKEKKPSCNALSAVQNPSTQPQENQIQEFTSPSESFK